jgi:ATP-dependent protease ClpP protease subunit
MDETETEETSEETELSEEELANILQEFVQSQSDDSGEIWSSNTLRYFGPQNRAILMTGELDEPQANALVSQVQELSQLDDEAPIHVHINTAGGSVIDALALYDILLCVPNPIITIVQGACFSAGLLIACAGEHRLVTPNSMYFYHQTVVQLMGIDSMHVMESNVGFYEWCNTTANNIMRERIKMTDEDWKEHFGHSTSKYFGAEDAVKYGFATGLIEYAEKPELILEGTEEECESSE